MTYMDHYNNKTYMVYITYIDIKKYRFNVYNDKLINILITIRASGNYLSY